MVRQLKICFDFIIEDMMLQEDLLKILPMINEANAMSEELDKKVCFIIVLRVISWKIVLTAAGFIAIALIILVETLRVSL